MAGHLLGVLEPSVVLQVNSDMGCPPGVTSNPGVRKPAFRARFLMRSSPPLRNCPPQPTLCHLHFPDGNFFTPAKIVYLVSGNSVRRHTQTSRLT